MKNNILRIIAFLLILAIIPVILLVTELSLPSIYSESYYAELNELYSRLSTAQGKKLVVLGSSNIAFGLDSELLEETLRSKGYDYTVCPFGLYAAVGTSAMLDLAEGCIGEGDIVVLSFEPCNAAMSSYFGATAFLKCAEDNPSLILKLDKSRSSTVVGNYIGYLQERIGIVSSGDYPKVEGVYAKSSFNESCNMTYNREGNIMTLGFDTAEPIDLNALAPEADFIEQVSEFCAKAAKAGASVYYSFCPMNRSALTDSSADAVEALYLTCAQSFPAKIISDPNRYILDSGWFYDSNFHLNSAGAVIRTARLAEDLLAQLGCYEAVDIDYPEMPAPVKQETVKTVTEGDTDCFEYESIADGEGYVISGLTEKGLSAESLTAPSVYEGKPVVGFNSDALNGAALKELRVTAGIESLPDYLFSQCPSIERLVLEHTDSPCSISDYSLAGADNLKIFVPESAYSLYRDGAGCERNVWSEYISLIYTY